MRRLNSINCVQLQTHIRRVITTVSVIAAATTIAVGAPRTADAASLVSPSSVSELQGPFVQAEVHVSLLSDAARSSMLAGTFGYGFKGGYRYCGWGFFLQVEQNLWLTTERDIRVVMGAVNIGVGAEVTYAGGFARTALSVGPSVLATDVAFNRRGTTGLFLDLRPIGLRFKIHPRIVIGVDPRSFAFVAPVLGNIPLINIQYRTSVHVEASW